jgi:uncharacterized protein (TIGR02271 family)
MQGVSVVRDDGTRGKIVADDGEGWLVVEFNDGSRFGISAKALIQEQDGTYRFSLHAPPLRGEAAGSEEMIIPVIAEELTVEKERVAKAKVRVHKRVESHEELANIPRTREEVTVERVQVNQFVDNEPPVVRDEDGVLIIPVLEEVLVVDKRLLLREEVRIYKRQTTTTTSQTVTLRREVVDLEREEINSTERSDTDTTRG